MIILRIIVIGALLALICLAGIAAIWREIDEWREERAKRGS